MTTFLLILIPLTLALILAGLVWGENWLANLDQDILDSESLEDWENFNSALGGNK